MPQRYRGGRNRSIRRECGILETRANLGLLKTTAHVLTNDFSAWAWQTGIIWPGVMLTLSCKPRRCEEVSLASIEGLRPL